MTTSITIKSNPTVAPKKKQQSPLFQLVPFLFNYAGRLSPSFAARMAMKLFMTPKRKPIDLPYIFEKAHILSVPYKDGKVWAYMWGFTGDIVVLVHGWESGPHAYEKFINPLVSAGYRVVAIEGPAHGLSLQRQTNMIDYGNAINSVLTRLEKSGHVTAIVGHSFGGSTLAQMFTRFPTPPTLEKIVMIASPSRIDQIFKNFFAMIQLPKEAIKHFEALLMQRYHLEIDGMQVTNWLHSIPQIKGMLIHDRDDNVIQFEEAESLVAHWPLAILKETEGHGHYRIMKSPYVVDSIIDFLG